MDPWLLLVFNDGEPALFGYCRSHHRLGGLSWALSSPVLSLDEAAGIARTRSGTLYLLGRRIRLDGLPDDEARAALEELSKAGNPGSGLTRAWLAACKTARWLGLPHPPRSDVAATAAFLGEHRSAYLALRANAGAAAGQERAPDIPGHFGAGQLPHAAAEAVHRAPDADLALSTVPARVMFSAKHRENRVTIGRADRDEVVALADGNGPEPRRDAIDSWSLIAIRGLSRGTRVHALGWRVGLANTWITSAIAGLRLGPIAISTASGHAYRLMSPDGAKLRPDLRAHLGHALLTWGFHDIQPE